MNDIEISTDQDEDKFFELEPNPTSVPLTRIRALIGIWRTRSTTITLIVDVTENGDEFWKQNMVSYGQSYQNILIFEY